MSGDEVKPPKFEHVAGPWPCRCGRGQVSIIETSDDRPGVVHTEPTCEKFNEIEDPVLFLRWVRTGRTDAD